MRSIVRLVPFVVLIVAACGGNEEPAAPPAAANPPAAGATATAPAAPEGPAFRTTVMGMQTSQPLASLDLGPAELPGLTIQAPDQARIERDSLGGFTILSAGVNYSIRIREGELDPDATKETYDIVDPDGTVVEDREDLVIYRRSGENGSFLFAAETAVGDAKYVCSTVATGFAFTRDQVDQMIASCRSLARAS